MERLVSIITAAYNASNTIEDTFHSILNQSYQNWEWIIVNDCSKDDTQKVLEKISKQDKRVVIFTLDKNSGAAVARNKGIELAKGDYIAFLDADDLWKPEKLKKQIEFMENNHHTFSYSDYDVLLDDGSTTTFFPKKTIASYKSLLSSNYIGCLTAIYDCKSLGKIYFPLDAIKREDHALWLDILKKSEHAYKINESLAIYRLGSSSVSSNKKKMFKFQYLMFRKHERFSVFKSLWYTLLVTFNKMFRKYNF